MGGLLVKNSALRCKVCFQLYSFRIHPEYPKCKINRKCRCSDTEVDIGEFLSEYKKDKTTSIFCSLCKKPYVKEYCYQCQRLYCSNCIKAAHNEKNNNLNHNLIDIEKYDFYCVLHQSENFVGYCKTCKLDLCLKCFKQKSHYEHKIFLYSSLYDVKKMREFFKKGIKSSEVKIDYNYKVLKTKII